MRRDQTPRQRRALVDFSRQRRKKCWRLSVVGMGSHSGLFFSNERFEARLDVSSVSKRQEGTMQLRHIRPGSLEWQDAKEDEVDQAVERLTPEEVVHLRKLSDERRGFGQGERSAQAR